MIGSISKWRSSRSRRGDEAESDCRLTGPAALSRLLQVLVLACLFLVNLPGSLLAQESVESRAFKTATRWFQTGVYDTAERELQRFVATYPQSPMLAEAILLQARSAIAQTNLARAISILDANMARAGLLTDQYRYRLAEAQLGTGDYAAAANSYALVLRQFTNSGLLLEAAYGEALARFKLRDFARVVTLLQDPNGAFQQMSKIRSSDRFSVSGTLLLAEAMFEQGQFDEAAGTVQTLSADSGKSEYPEYEWDRQHLLSRILIAKRQLPEALAHTTNLLAAAVTTGNRSWVADAYATRAGVLRQLDRLEESFLTFTNNLADNIPDDRRRLALLNIIELKLAQGNAAEASLRLQDYLTRRPQDAVTDVLQVTAGELQMRLHFAESAAGATNPVAGAPVTNRLQLALTQFQRVPTNSPLLGKAALNRGWCLWLDNRLAESIPAFRTATERLPFSEDLAVARFKLADGLYQQGDYTNALNLYMSVTNDFAAVPRVRASLFDQVLHQITRVNIQIGDVDAASASMSQLLEVYPNSVFSERSMWLVGQELIEAREPARARNVFTDFVKRFPDRPLLSKVELAIARTYFHEGNYAEAIRGYDEWVTRYPTNDLLVRAEFNRAWANAKSGNSSVAFQLFTNFVARYPTNDLSRDAQFWVAEEYFRRGNFPEAQRGYQLIVESTNWVRSPMTYQARMMAGRAAFSAQLWKDASDHFTKLIEDAENCPIEILAEAHFALGDTFIRDDASVRTDTPGGRTLGKYSDAKTSFERITQLSVFVTNKLVAPFVPLAWGRIGDCSLQLASEDPRQYDAATNAYHQAMTHPAADPATRSLAEFGLAHALEVQGLEKERAPEVRAALLKQAFEHYFNIVIGGGLNVRSQPDPVWVEKAGFAAGRVAETQTQWALALNVYKTMHEVLPPLRPRLTEKMNKVSEQLGGGKK